MRSLSQLNTRGQTTLPYTDNRAAQVIFDRVTPINQNQSVFQGGTLNVQPGIEITEIVQPNVVNVYYEIDVSDVPGATVSWTSPPGTVVISNPSTGLYRASNIDSAADWLAVRNPTINLPVGYTDEFSYTAIIYYEPSKSKITTVGVVFKTLLSAIFNVVQAKLTGIAASVVDMAGTFTQTAQGRRARLAAASMSAFNSTLAAGVRVVGPVSSVMSSAFTFAAKATGITKATASISATASLASAARRFRGLVINTSAAFSLATNIFTRLSKTGATSFTDAINANAGFYAVGANTGIRLYNTDTRALVRTISAPAGWQYIRMSTSYTGAAIIGASASLSIYNNSTGALVTTITNPGPSGNIFATNDAEMTDTYTAIADLGYDESGMPSNTGRVYIYSTTSGSQVRTFNIPYTPTATNERWGDRLKVQGNNIFIPGNPSGTATLYVYSMSTGSLAYTITGFAVGDDHYNVKVNSNYIFIPNGDTVKLYNISDGTYVKTLTLDARSGYSGNANIFVSNIYIMRYDMIYNISTGTKVYTLDNPEYNPDPGIEEFDNRALAGNKLLVNYDAGVSVEDWVVWGVDL